MSKENQQTMMLVKSSWQESQTFRMIPTSESCPYVEFIYDPSTNVFVIISKITKHTLHMLPKLDEYGQPVTGSKGMKQDRHKIEVFQEFYIEDKTAIKDLITLFALNAKTFDFEAFMISTETPNT